MSSYSNPYYDFTPSAAAAIALVVIFFTLICSHIAAVTYTRRVFAASLIVGGLAEFVGFLSRTVSCYELPNLSAYSAQRIALLLGPTILSDATNFFLSQAIAASAFTRYSIIPPVYIAYGLSLINAGVMALQLWGAAKLVNPDSAAQQRWASHIVCAGLGLQLVVPVSCVALAAVFYVRLRRHNVVALTRPRLRIGLSMATVCVVSALVAIRTAFRLVQYIHGANGLLETHEWPIYALDGALMAVFMAVGILWHGVDLEVPRDDNTERDLEVPLGRLASVTHADVVRMKSFMAGKVGQKNVHGVVTVIDPAVR